MGNYEKKSQLKIIAFLPFVCFGFPCKRGLFNTKPGIIPITG